MDIIYNLYRGLRYYQNSLDYSKIHFSIYYGSKTKFYYKEEVVTKSFHTYIFIYFIS